MLLRHPVPHNPQPRGWMPDPESETRRHYARACRRHSRLLIGAGEDACPCGHWCRSVKSWRVVEVLGDGSLRVPPDPEPVSAKVAGRTADGFAETLASRMRRARAVANAGVAAAIKARHNRERTHCYRGHALTGDNEVWLPRAGGGRWRGCRACKQATMRAYLGRRREADRAGRRADKQAEVQAEVSA